MDFVIGEAAGVIILEDRDHAVQRGAENLLRNSWRGRHCRCPHITAPHPEGLGAKNVMLAALEDAGMQPVILIISILMVLQPTW
jgi:3-oxoacyl-[acyl-carrier-protein] synthase II